MGTKCVLNIGFSASIPFFRPCKTTDKRLFFNEKQKKGVLLYAILVNQPESPSDPPGVVDNPAEALPKLGRKRHYITVYRLL